MLSYPLCRQILSANRKLNANRQMIAFVVVIHTIFSGLHRQFYSPSVTKHSSFRVVTKIEPSHKSVEATGPSAEVHRAKLAMAEAAGSSSLSEERRSKGERDSPSAAYRSKREYKSDKRKAKQKKPESRPNAFVSLPITNLQIKERMAALQAQVIENEKSVQSLIVLPETFHLTLMVMDLKPEDTQIATAALEEAVKSVEKLLSEVNYTLTFQKLSSFGEKVVFITMADENEISVFRAAAAEVRKVFEAHGLPSTDERPANPHVTLFKTRYQYAGGY